MTIYDLVTCCRAKGILYIVFGIQMSISPRNMLQGNPVQEATLVLRLGGRHVTEQLMNQVKITTYYTIITLDISITIIISIIFLVVTSPSHQWLNHHLSLLHDCQSKPSLNMFSSSLTWSTVYLHHGLSRNTLQTSNIWRKKQNMEGLWNVCRPQLLNGKYSFPDDNFMLWRKKKKTNFTVSSRKEIIREMKVGKGWNLIESERKDVEGCWWGIPCIFLNWWI